VIGVDLGDEDYVFESVVNAKFLPDDRVAVADAGLFNVRVFDSDGSFVRAIGRRGSGPGEFTTIFGFWLSPGGLLCVWDPRSRRVTSFRADGQRVSTARLDESGRGNLEVFFGALPDKSVVLGSLVERFDSAGVHLGQSGSVRGMRRWEGNPVPYSPLPWSAVVADTMFVADGYDPVVEVRDRFGMTQRTFPVQPVAPASRDDWARLREALERPNDDIPASSLFRNLLAQGAMPFDSRVPSVAGMLADSEGLLWVKEYDPAVDPIWLRLRATQPAPGGRWNIYDPRNGRAVAFVEMPDNAVPLDVTESRILALTTDRLGVQRIAVVTLHRTGAPRRQGETVVSG
jgi:hypothetical protein